MMRKFSPLYLVIALLVVCVAVSCKKKTEDTEQEQSYYSHTASSVSVTAFALQDNADMLKNLSKVQFTIDPTNSVIFNADSLPKGTKIRKLLTSITYANTASSAQIRIKGGSLMSDTIFDYKNTDSIDFTGTVHLIIVSQDKLVTREWLLKLNVHNVEGDSLYWDKMARRDLPGAKPELEESRTVCFQGTAYCFTKCNGVVTLATAEHADNEVWNTTSVAMPLDADITTITANEQALYMLTNSGKLLRSGDGRYWSDCGVTWEAIVGGYDNSLLGIATADDGTLVHDVYPQPSFFIPTAIEDNFPVKGSSDMVCSSTKWAEKPQGMILGGVLADGTVCGHAWAYDGEKWAIIGENVIEPHYGMTLVPYYSFTAQSNWSFKKNDTYFAFGGYNELGEIDNMVYSSRDWGANWRLGDELVTLPEYIEPFAFASALVYSTEYAINTRSANAWSSFPSNPLHPWCTPIEEIHTRTTKPITEWECPCIYIFGGYNEQGEQLNNVWRGALNRFTFDPIY